MSGAQWAAVVPLVIVAVAFVAYCLRDVSAQASTKHLPKWAWAVLCVISVPLGGIVYLVIGRQDAQPLTDADL